MTLSKIDRVSLALLASTALCSPAFAQETTGDSPAPNTNATQVTGETPRKRSRLPDLKSRNAQALAAPQNLAARADGFALDIKRSSLSQGEAAPLGGATVVMPPAPSLTASAATPPRPRATG